MGSYLNKKLVTIGIVAILFCVVCSGCTNESRQDLDTAVKSVSVIMEAIAQVVNGSGEPVENVSVTFDVAIGGNIHSSIVRTTDSTGWTPFAVAELLLPLNEVAVLSVYITGTNTGVRNSVDHKYAKENQVNNAYYWSYSARIVQD